MQYKLRQYQNKGLTDLRSKIVEEQLKKLIYFLATGGGKGLVMSELNRSAVFNQKRVLNLMRRKSLITQTQNNYNKYHGLDSSIIMGTHRGFNPEKNIQIASIDSIQRRLHREDHQFLRDFDIIVVDEMHDSTSKGYQNTFEWLGDDKIFIGFSASPFHVGRRGHTFWEDYVKPIEMHELRDQGYLVADKTYTPKAIDVTGVKKIAGEFSEKDLFKKVSGTQIIGDIVNSYKEYGENKPFILFAVNVEHSKLMAQAFCEAGIPAAHADADTPEEERMKIINDSKRGKIKGICNVNIFSTGVDLPWIEVGSMCRPTMSPILYVQQAGRPLRPFKICICGAENGGDASCLHCGSTVFKYEKKFAIFLDHANNTARHGLIYDPRDVALKDKVGRDSFVPLVKQCPDCKIWMKKSKSKCDECGYDFNANKEKQDRKILEVDGELELVDMKEQVLKKYNSLVKSARYMGWTQKKIYDELYKKFGLLAFDYIKVPDKIREGYQVDGLLSSASRIAGKNFDRMPGKNKRDSAF